MDTWTVDSGKWTVDTWTVDSGHVDSGQRTRCQWTVQWTRGQSDQVDQRLAGHHQSLEFELVLVTCNVCEDSMK